jgi:hypothetical protein
VVIQERYLTRRLNHLVKQATSSVPLYKLLYGANSRISSLEEFAHLPILTSTILGTERLEDTLTDLGQVCISRTFEEGTRHDGYMPKLLSYDDALDEYKVLAFLMEFARVEGWHKILLIADEQHLYNMTEFGKYLAYYEWPLAAAVWRSQNSGYLKTYLSEFKPTIVFADSQSEPALDLLPSSVQSVFTFNRPNAYGTHMLPFQLFDIFRDGRAGLTAIKARTDGDYTFDPRYFYLENASDGTLLVTSFVNRLQPVIRYRPSRQGRIIGANKVFLVN